MTDMREDERERIGRLANEICGCSTLEQHRRDIALIEAEIDRRVAEERAKLLERLRDDLNIAIELIQEAKGYEGPKGGPITDHLDAAEGRIDRVLAQFEKETSHEQG